MQYTKVFGKVKAIIKEGLCMRFYDETKLLFIEMNKIWSWTQSCLATNLLSVEKDTAILKEKH